MSPGHDRGRPLPESGPSVEKVTTTTDLTIMPCPTDEIARARARRAARLAHAHVRQAGLDSELVRRVLGVGA